MPTHSQPVPTVGARCAAACPIACPMRRMRMAKHLPNCNDSPLSSHLHPVLAESADNPVTRCTFPLASRERVRRNVEQGPRFPGMRPRRARRSNADPMRVSGVRSPEGPLFRPTTRHPTTVRLEPAPPSAGAGVRASFSKARWRPSGPVRGDTQGRCASRGGSRR